MNIERRVRQSARGPWFAHELLGDEVRRSVQQWSLSGGSVAGAAWLFQPLVLNIAEEAWPEKGIGLLDVG
jgi:hypothetical protein